MLELRLESLGREGSGSGGGGGSRERSVPGIAIVNALVKRCSAGPIGNGATPVARDNELIYPPFTVQFKSIITLWSMIEPDYAVSVSSQGINPQTRLWKHTNVFGNSHDFHFRLNLRAGTAVMMLVLAEGYSRNTPRVG